MALYMNYVNNFLIYLNKKKYSQKVIFGNVMSTFHGKSNVLFIGTDSKSSEIPRNRRQSKYGHIVKDKACGKTKKNKKKKKKKKKPNKQKTKQTKK